MNTIFYNYLEQKQTYKYEAKYHCIGITYNMYIKKQICFVVCFLLGNSPASEFYLPTFRNTLFHLHRRVGTQMEQSVPKRWHDGSLKSRNLLVGCVTVPPLSRYAYCCLRKARSMLREICCACSIDRVFRHYSVNSSRYVSCVNVRDCVVFCIPH